MHVQNIILDLLWVTFVVIVVLIFLTLIGGRNVWLRASTADEINTLVDVGFQTSVFNYVATISKALPYSPMHQRYESLLNRKFVY